ncbi:hypothetical protein HPP92_000653 [Vanilla planifolia]|uniref:Uncharacterized protein n=1 Tax=Vanilla planifolia TaxID=51239 RepID=A0A835S1Z0_VANPL|nr:hypothetical protein HPP92_000744 [Vanilla planifolia]KAG0500581.1 hypothetical protein HPP92_000653 [Vanilla planifolia]
MKYHRPKSDSVISTNGFHHHSPPDSRSPPPPCDVTPPELGGGEAVSRPTFFGGSFSRDVSVSAVGDVSADSNGCPECDGAGFVREAGASLRANAARKDLPQIVCPRCNGLGKLGQIDK